MGDLVDAVMLMETRRSLDETRLAAGGKRSRKETRSPDVEIPSHPLVPVTKSSVPSLRLHQS